MRVLILFQAFTIATLVDAAAPAAMAQTPDSPSRESVVEEAQAEKVPTLHPYVLTTGERLMDRAEKVKGRR
jgi:hypothetical protein